WPLSASAWRTRLRSASECTPRSAATCAIGRFDSNTSRTPRSINSCGYFRPLGIAGESPLPRTDHPGSEASVKPGLAQTARAPSGEEWCVSRRWVSRPKPHWRKLNLGKPSGDGLLSIPDVGGPDEFVPGLALIVAVFVFAVVLIPLLLFGI